LLDFQKGRPVLITAFPRAKSAGFTLIELLVAVMVLIVLVGLGMPSFLQMLRNSEMRAAAEGVANGLQRARAEAVSKNAKIQFVLGSGTSWTVDYVTKPVSTDPVIDSRESNEGSPHALLVAVAADLSTAATTVTFNQLGQVVANTPASPSIAQITLTAPAGNQTLRVTVGVGGNTRVCDPGVSSPNVRAC
jgi:type IV fimbrial biogenesis protein FimT